MTYLGVDQSLTGTGVALVDDEGGVMKVSTIKPGQRRGVERLAYIRDQLQEWVSEPGLKQAAIEGYSYGSVLGGRVFELGEVGGLVRLVLHDMAVACVVAAPAQVKKFLSSNGQADKDKMRAALIRKKGLDLDDDNQVDAVALALIARLYCVKISSDRSELEVVQQLLEGPKTKSSTAKSKVKMDI